MDEVLKKLNQIQDIEILLEYNLKNYSTLQLKATGNLIVVKSIVALVETIKSLKSTPYIVLGWGANQMLSETFEGYYLKLSLPFEKNYLDLVQENYLLPASVSLATLTSHAAKFGLRGWHVFTGIPASLGGAIFMNAGTNLGEIGTLVSRVYYVSKDGEQKVHVVDEKSFSYRKSNFLNYGDVVYRVELKNLGIDEEIKSTIRDYLLKRNKTQPMKEKTCGCVFKNFEAEYSTCRAGEYLDIMGLKGLTFGDIQISPVHANFMINKGNGTKKEMLTLIKAVQDELNLQFGIKFDTEVKF